MLFKVVRPVCDSFGKLEGVGQWQRREWGVRQNIISQWDEKG